MHQFVTLTRGGEPVKQSTRRATFVTVDEVLGEVGADVFRFFMVQRRAETHLDFDLDLAEDTDWKKNPAYYVQYAHARSYGIERKASEQGVAMPDAASVDAAPLVLPEEIELLKKLAEFPEVVRARRTRASRTTSPTTCASSRGSGIRTCRTGCATGSCRTIAALTSGRLGLRSAVRIACERPRCSASAHRSGCDEGESGSVTRGGSRRSPARRCSSSWASRWGSLRARSSRSRASWSPSSPAGRVGRGRRERAPSRGASRRLPGGSPKRPPSRCAESRRRRAATAPAPPSESPERRRRSRDSRRAAGGGEAAGRAKPRPPRREARPKPRRARRRSRRAADAGTAASRCRSARSPTARAPTSCAQLAARGFDAYVAPPAAGRSAGASASARARARSAEESRPRSPGREAPDLGPGRRRRALSGGASALVRDAGRRPARPALSRARRAAQVAARRATSPSSTSPIRTRRARSRPGARRRVEHGAFTHVDRCETEPELRAARQRGAPRCSRRRARARPRLVHVSTDYVFDGAGARRTARTTRPRRARLRPQQARGRARGARGARPSSLIVRTSWVFGPGPELHAAILDQAAHRRGGAWTAARRRRPARPAHLRGRPRGRRSSRWSNSGDRPRPLANRGEATWWDLAAHALDEAGFARPRDRPDPDRGICASGAAPGLVRARHVERGRWAYAASLAGRRAGLPELDAFAAARRGRETPHELTL